MSNAFLKSTKTAVVVNPLSKPSAMSSMTSAKALPVDLFFLNPFSFLSSMLFSSRWLLSCSCVIDSSILPGTGSNDIGLNLSGVFGLFTFGMGTTFASFQGDGILLSI